VARVLVPDSKLTTARALNPESATLTLGEGRSRNKPQQSMRYCFASSCGQCRPSGSKPTPAARRSVCSQRSISHPGVRGVAGGQWLHRIQRGRSADSRRASSRQASGPDPRGQRNRVHLAGTRPLGVLERCRPGLQSPERTGDNCFIESFNGTVRRECLSQHWFTGLEDAQRTLDAWREDYNNHRPHRSLANRSPAKYRGGGYCLPDLHRLGVLAAS
jgi:transposase InsO family protein